MFIVFKEVDFSDLIEVFLVFFVFVMIFYIYLIVDGIGVGFISYIIFKVFSGCWKEVYLLMYVLIIVFVVYFVYFGGVF